LSADWEASPAALPPPTTAGSEDDAFSALLEPVKKSGMATAVLSRYGTRVLLDHAA